MIRTCLDRILESQECILGALESQESTIHHTALLSQVGNIGHCIVAILYISDIYLKGRSLVAKLICISRCKLM